MTNLSAIPALTEGRTCSLEAHSAHEAPAVAPRMGGRLLLARRTDERLVELVRQGDAAAFEVLYDRYHLRILSFCRHMLSSQEEAESRITDERRREHVFMRPTPFDQSWESSCQVDEALSRTCL